MPATSSTKGSEAQLSNKTVGVLTQRIRTLSFSSPFAMKVKGQQRSTSPQARPRTTSSSKVRRPVLPLGRTGNTDYKSVHAQTSSVSAIDIKSDFSPVFSSVQTSIGCHSVAATLPIKGQGTVSISTASGADALTVVLSCDHEFPRSLYLNVNHNTCSFYTEVAGSNVIPAKKPRGHEAAAWSSTSKKCTHWISLDRCNGVLRYGRGYLSAKLTLLEVRLKQRTCHGVMAWEDKDWAWLGDIVDIVVTQSGGGQAGLSVTTYALPIVEDLPPRIISDQDITLHDLDNGEYTSVANLPVECQQLYANVAGPNIRIDDPSFPDFREAIEHSVNTEGCIAWKLLKHKSGEFGKDDFESTYLRITIGCDRGESPGIPYVLEIWPAGHASPVHDHGDSFAVIKVLSGTIHAYYFDSLDSPDGPHQIGEPVVLNEGDVTWIADQHYQVHQLRNLSMTGRICCTLQCYQYGKDDRQHYEFFRYLTTDERPRQEDFRPNSDMSFGDFKRAIQAEWNLHQASLSQEQS